MHKYAILMPGLLLLLTACTTVPSVQTLAVCPKLPPLESAAPESAFLPPMLNFLSGRLDAPTGSGLGLKLAKPPTTLRATP